MEKWILVVGTNCTDPAREPEFNRWYDEVHLPDILETPGFTGATRYENSDTSEGQAKFLANYHIETDDIDALMKANAENIAVKREAGRLSELLEIVWRGLYKETSSLSK